MKRAGRYELRQVASGVSGNVLIRLTYDVEGFVQSVRGKERNVWNVACRRVSKTGLKRRLSFCVYGAGPAASRNNIQVSAGGGGVTSSQSGGGAGVVPWNFRNITQRGSGDWCCRGRIRRTPKCTRGIVEIGPADSDVKWRGSSPTDSNAFRRAGHTVGIIAPCGAIVPGGNGNCNPFRSGLLPQRV